MGSRQQPAVTVCGAAAMMQVISLATDLAIKVWDLKGQRCVQTIEAKDWPEAQDAKPGSIWFDDAAGRLLTAALRPVAWSREPGAGGVAGHTCRVVAALYNTTFDLVRAWSARTAARPCCRTMCLGGGWICERKRQLPRSVCAHAYDSAAATCAVCSAWSSRGLLSESWKHFSGPGACCCLLPQVVSCDSSGVMCVWDYHTGRRREHNAALHGNRPLTAAAFDARQVETTCLSGTVKPPELFMICKAAAENSPSYCLMAATIVAEAAADCIGRRQRQIMELQQRGAAPPVQVHRAAQCDHVPALCPRRPEGVQQGPLLSPPAQQCRRRAQYTQPAGSGSLITTVRGIVPRNACPIH